MDLILSPAGLQAVASIGWLLLAIAVVSFAIPLINRLARDRAFSVKIAGIELSAQDATENITSAVKDLQESVRRIEEWQIQFSSTSTSVPERPAEARETMDYRGRRILWVDDYPSNNALVVEKLQDDGFQVDLALSTKEGLGLFKRRTYDMVLSDMGRRENSREVSDAGVQLTRQIRSLDANIPILIFCSTRAVEYFGQAAKNAGALFVTSSALELYRQIENHIQSREQK